MTDTRYWQERLPDNIFLTAKMAAGKDFVAAQLVREAGFTRLAFADALKAEVAQTHGISVPELESRKAEFRAELQRVGVARREEDQNYWVNRWAETRSGIPGPVVCTDVRFPNEAQYGMQIGALVVRLVAPDDVRLDRLLLRDGNFDPATLNHISEQFIDGLQVHVELSGELAGSMYVPSLVAVYQKLSELVFREAIIGVQAKGGQ